MTKLLSLKNWVTLDEAAHHLTSMFDEDVSVADIYRFALTGHLTVTAHFVNGTSARLGRKMRIRDAGFKITAAIVKGDSDDGVTRMDFNAAALPEFEAWLDDNEPMRLALTSPDPKTKFVLLKGLQISDTECIQFREEVSGVHGLWDLVMIGGARLDIEHALQGVLDGPSVEGVCLDGICLSDADGHFAWLQEAFDDKSKDYFPASGLPEGTPIVVRPEAIFSFVSKVAEGEEKTLDTRERTNMLRIIRALAVIAKLPERGATGAVEKQLQELGFDTPKEATIRAVLKEAGETQP